MNESKSRARPLSPDERRTAILDAVTPLLIERGASVTTAEMAEAAGIAEGTIFRVFPDKLALLHAAIARAMDPAPIREALDGIDPNSPLRDQLIAAVGVLTELFEGVTALLAVVRSIPHDKGPGDEAHQTAHDSMAEIAAAATDLLDRNRDRLSVEPAVAAILLRGLVFSRVHPVLSQEGTLGIDTLVEILCDGIARRETA